MVIDVGAILFNVVLGLVDGGFGVTGDWVPVLGGDGASNLPL